jgi:DNA (cytosine-5)-methyltransferase 1
MTGGLTIGSLFSGIGGLELGLEQSGLGHAVWQVEQDPHCRAVLAHHWPHAERFEDVREVGAAQLVRVDLVCGGFPCQDVSSAGGRAGLAGARSGLWYEFARIVAELRPRWVVVENVASGAKLWVDAVRGDLGELGYASLPIPIKAGWLGAPYKRGRIFVVARVDGERKPAGAEHAEVASASADAAHALRSGCKRAGSGEAHEGRQRSLSGDWSDRAEPEMVRVVSGLSRRSYASDGEWQLARAARRRIKALGNSVVPAQAEVVGHVIRHLLSLP